MSYKFYLDGVILPITPSSLSLKINNQNETINLINHGEVNILKNAGLSEFDFEFIIPQSNYPFANVQYKNAAYYLEKLESLKVSKRPFRFTVSRKTPSGGILFDTDMSVSLEEYTVDENAANGRDITVSVSLKQYRAYHTKKIPLPVTNTSTAKKVVPPTTSAPRAPGPTQPKKRTYTVVRGDCLWKIAKRFLGNGLRWTEIYNLNKKVIGKNPNLIYPGQVFVLP